MPDSVLHGLSISRRTEGWNEWLTPDPAARRDLEGLGRIVADAMTWIAERDGNVVGFVNAGPSRDEDVATRIGEVYAIYVLPEAWDTSVGAELMNTGLLWLRETYRSATLWVLEGNERGRRFYEVGGWKPDGRVQELDFAGTKLNEVGYRIDLTRVSPRTTR